jgi:endonuclease G, mitochondrial
MIPRPVSYRRLISLTVALAGVSGVLIAVSTVAARSARREAAARPVILLLHGRGQLGRDTADIRRDWEHALEVGVGGLTRQPLIDTNDVRLVWYADVLDPASVSSGCDEEERRARARARTPTPDDDGEILQLIFGITSALFTSLYESIPEESRASMRAVVGDILYLGDSWRRCGVERRIESALARAAREDRPVVLVAHSFGSLVAYSYLRSDRARAESSRPVIHRFVTLGSMLGIPELQQLLLGRTGALSLPANVRSWVNVRHTDDPFALPLTGATSADGAKRFHEVVIQAAAADPHDIRTYLRDPAGARAIVWAWCDAFRGTRPAACSTVQRDVP